MDENMLSHDKLSWEHLVKEKQQIEIDLMVGADYQTLHSVKVKGDKQAKASDTAGSTCQTLQGLCQYGVPLMHISWSTLYSS